MNESAGAPAPDAAPAQDARPATTAKELVERAAGIGVLVTSAQAAKMLAYLDRILEINKSLNLTAVRDREDAVVRHILDSLTAVEAWTSLTKTLSPRTYIDLGTGGGFPGAILAAAWPETRCLLVDQTGKKLKAVADAAAAAGIDNIEVLHARGSQMRKLFPRTRGAFELATARAVAPVEEIISEVISSVGPRGWIFAMKGPEPPADELAAGEATAVKFGFEPYPIRHTNVPSLERRTILVYRSR